MNQISLEKNKKSPKELSPAAANKLRRLLRKGKKLIETGEQAQGTKYILEAWNLNPDDMNLMVAVADCLIKLGIRDKAIRFLEEVLSRHGATPEVIRTMGLLASEFEMNDTLEKLYRIYITLEPGDPLGYNNLASALEKQDKLDEAISFLQDVIPLFPEIPALWNTLASSVAIRDGYQTSIPFYDEAYRLAPENVEVLSNIALVASQMGDFARAIEFSERTIRLAPKAYRSHFTLGMSLLTIGNLAEGWKEYEWRRQERGRNIAFYTSDSPRWSGEDLSGKRLLISPEQGLGDEVLFAISYPRLAAMAKQLYIGCDHRLVTLFERSFPGARIGRYVDKFHHGYRLRTMPALQKNTQKGPEAEAFAEADYYIECGSVPFHHWQRVEDLPDFPDGFLKPDPERVALWRERLAALGPKPKIGIFWRSGLQTATRNKHYAPIDAWGPLFERFKDTVDFINLQYGECSAEREQVRKAYGVTLHHWDDCDLRNDLETVAALSKAVDLVIGPASAPSMFSFAVGTPTWWVMPIRPWWSFGATERTRFFSKGRMFLGTVDNPWAELMPRVVEALAEHLGAR